MQNAEVELGERTKRFAVRVVKMFAGLPKPEECRVIGKQVLRSGTSIGANYREARAARSQDEFIAKLGDCHKETDETIYWLELLIEADLITESKLAPMLREANELKAIFITSLKTAKKSRAAARATT